MIRGEKRAKVTYCKEAKTLAPVPAHTQSPRSSQVRDGDKSAKAVKEARIILPEMQGESPAKVVAAEPVESIAVRTQPAQEEVFREEQVQPKSMHCKNANKDITLQTLFQDWEGMSG